MSVKPENVSWWENARGTVRLLYGTEREGLSDYPTVVEFEGPVGSAVSVRGVDLDSVLEAARLLTEAEDTR